MKKGNKDNNRMTFGDCVQGFIVVMFLICLVTLGCLIKEIALNSDKIEKLYDHFDLLYIPKHSNAVAPEATTYKVARERFWKGEIDFKLLYPIIIKERDD